MGRQPAEELTARWSIVDMQERVRAEIGCGSRPQDGRLDVVQIECRRARRTSAAGMLPDGGHDVTCPRAYPISSRNPSTALPMRPSRRVSATVRFGLATYQASAAIWCLTIQSLTDGL